MDDPYCFKVHYCSADTAVCNHQSCKTANNFFFEHNRTPCKWKENGDWSADYNCILSAKYRAWVEGPFILAITEH